MTNPVYQATIEELEAVLSPRVVSRSVKEGLNQVGRTPDTAGIEDIEKILKAQVYRQLQLTMPVTRAKEAVAEMIERLRQVSDGSEGRAGGESGLQAQEEELRKLQEAQKPFNLYFEWPEVQKLRAQIQLLEADQEAGREAPALVKGALDQLQLVMQKREDQLVLQARDLGELLEALEEVRPAGGPKLRRLETLVNQVRAAQENRQLAAAERDRAQRLARDLRVALEEESAASDGEAAAADAPQAATASAQAAEPPAETPPLAEPLDVEAEEAELLSVDAPKLDEAASERIRRIDLSAEQRELRKLESEFAQVLVYVPELGERLAELRSELDESRSVQPILSGLGADLEATKLALRDDLRDELEEVIGRLPTLRADVDTTELEQAARVTLGILTTALPSLADVEHVRRLAQVAREQDEEIGQSEALYAKQLEEQNVLIGRLEATLLQNDADDEAVLAEVEHLKAEFDQLRLAQEQQTVVPEVVAAVRQAEERLARTLAERATERSERRHARLTALRAQLENLPVTETLSDRSEAARLEIESLLTRQENEGAVAALLIDDAPVLGADDGDIDALSQVVDGIRTQLTASLRNRLMSMAEAAAELGNNQLIERLQRAVLGLERDEYPDIKQLQASLKSEHEAQRLEQLDELHRLELAAGQFTGEESPRAVQLRQLLLEAHAQLERGALAPQLARASELVDALQAEADERLASVPRRLDTALLELEKVAALNSDDVGTARRILNHLDSQRGALPRLSPGLQLQLEASLTSAERLLEKLQGEFEATRLVADELVSGGLLDGVLGLFRTGGEEGVISVSGATEGLEATSNSPEALLEAFREEDGVLGAALLDVGGELVSGRLTGDYAALPQARAAAAGLLGEGGAPRLLTLEHAGGVLVAGWLASGDSFVFELEDTSNLAIFTNRLRRRLALLEKRS